jgi:CRISPR-associated protein Csd1
LVGFKKELQNNVKGEAEEITKRVEYIGCPSFNDILFAVYGINYAKDKSELLLKKKIQKQLLECIFGNFAFPKSFVDAAAARVSKPFSFSDANGKFDELGWRRALEIACSLIKKDIKQDIKRGIKKEKEDIQMELDESKCDRDYLYGRLLSVADKLEQIALYNQDKKSQRTTNALRLMNSFAVKPYTTWGALFEQINPYMRQLSGGSAHYYQSLIDDILHLIGDDEYKDNRPLSPMYILGYSAQNYWFRKNADKNKDKNNNQEDINNGDATE